MLNIKQAAFTILFSLLIANSITAETSDPTYNQLGISISNIGTYEEVYYSNRNHLNLQLEYLHGINRYFTVGGYIGYGIYEEWSNEIDDDPQNYSTFSSMYIKSSSSAHYGINGILHILPILDLRSSYHDVYINGRVGMISMFTTTEGEDITPQGGHYFNYSLVGGYTFYAWQHVGFFVEYGFNISEYTRKTSARFGMKFDL